MKALIKDLVLGTFIALAILGFLFWGYIFFGG